MSASDSDAQFTAGNILKACLAAGFSMDQYETLKNDVPSAKVVYMGVLTVWKRYGMITANLTPTPNFAKLASNPNIPKDILNEFLFKIRHDSTDRAEIKVRKYAVTQVVKRLKQEKKLTSEESKDLNQKLMTTNTDGLTAWISLKTKNEKKKEEEKIDKTVGSDDKDSQLKLTADTIILYLKNMDERPMKMKYSEYLKMPKNGENVTMQCPDGSIVIVGKDDMMKVNREIYTGLYQAGGSENTPKESELSKFFPADLVSKSAKNLEELMTDLESKLGSVTVDFTQFGRE